DYFEQLFAKLRCIPGGDFALADDAGEWRPHLRAIQLLPGGDYACSGRFEIALLGVALGLGIFQLLDGDNTALAQCGHALELPLSLLESVLGSALGRLGGGQGVTDRSVVEAHEQIPAFDRVAVFLENLEHYSRNLGLQVGPSLRL